MSFMARKSYETVFVIESPGTFVFRIHKKPDDPGLFCNENRSPDRVRQKQATPSLTMESAINCQSRKPNSGKSMGRIFLCVSLGEQIRVDFTECEGEISEDDGRFFRFGQNKGSRNPLVAMLPGHRLEIGIQFRNAAIESGAGMTA